jgi:hypothetical protein
MRINKEIFYSLVIILVFVIACKKDDASSEDDEKNPLFGKWEWLYSVGGIAGHHINPDSVGYNISVEFTANGMYRNYRDDTIFFTDTYVIKDFVDPCSFEFIVEYENAPYITQQFCAFSGDTMLRLQDNCLDCYDNYYIRK